MPYSTRRWVRYNDMRKHLKGQRVMATHRASWNRLFLRRDIHFLFYQNHIVLVPMRDSDDNDKYRLVTHVLDGPNKSQPSDMEIITMYQNIPCLPLPHVPVEFLFARFAWSLFINHICLFTWYDEDDTTPLYSVRILEATNGRKKEPVEKMVSIRELLSLVPEASGVCGKKRDRSQVDQDVDGRRDLIYDGQTGNMVHYDTIDDGTEPGDCGIDSDYDSDDYGPPSKRSRSYSSEN